MSIKMSSYPRRTKIDGVMWDLYDGCSNEVEVEKSLTRFRSMPTNQLMKFKVVKQSHIVGDPVFLIYKRYR